MDHSATLEDTFYVVNMTPEHSPYATPTLACLCQYHYDQAVSCRMIRRTLVVRSRVSPSVDWVAECKFC